MIMAQAEVSSAALGSIFFFANDQKGPIAATVYEQTGKLHPEKLLAG